MPGTLRLGRAVDLGGRPRASFYASADGGVSYRGVNAKAQQNAAPTNGRIAAVAPVGLAGMEAQNAANVNGIRNIRYPGVRPRPALGPLPKLAAGSGRTARMPASALGYTPGGYTPPKQIFGAGLEYMPYLQTDNRSALDTAAPGVPSGLPARGVSATYGEELAPTYNPHDWSTWVNRFITQGRSPGAWQEPQFPPGYRSLIRRRPYPGYNLRNPVALARPLSQSAYMLPWATPANVAANIGGAGVGMPLGYTS